jgi:hypothetical protein
MDFRDSTILEECYLMTRSECHGVRIGAEVLES